MSRSQRHLREYQGYDSSGQSSAGGGVVPGAPKVSFVGTVANQTGNQSVAFSMSVAGNFAGTDTPFTYTVQAGTLPNLVTLSASTGVISGTPDTIALSSGIVIRCTDASGDTADTNSFSIDIQA